MDQWLELAEATISLGVREMACRLNGDGKNFDKAAANLARTAQVRLSGETLRVLVEAEGKRVLQAQRSGQLPLDWSALDCRTEQATTRVYFGSDGVTVPLVTDAEKSSRRQKVKQKRKRRGKKSRPLPPRKVGADQRYKEFKIIAFYDETQEHRLVCGTRGDHAVAGRLMRREAARSVLTWPMRRWATWMAPRGFAMRFNGRACRWMLWGSTSFTLRKTYTRRAASCSVKQENRARPGPAICCTRSNTTATRLAGRRW